MCDHNDMSQLKINKLQISDGNIRYTCIHCNQTISSNDNEFNRKYKLLYDSCKTHSFEHDELINIKDSNGNIHCLWCGLIPDNQ